MSLTRVGMTAVPIAVFLIAACGDDKTPTDVPSNPVPVVIEIEVGDPDVQARLGAEPGSTPRRRPVQLSSLSLSALRASMMQSETVEICEDGERCVEQGDDYIGSVRVTCLDGPGNCGSWTYGWAMQNPPPGTTVTFTPTETQLEEWTTVKIETNSDTELGTTSSFIQVLPPPGAPPGPAGIPYLVHVMCSTTLESCPELEIVDLQQGNDFVVSEGDPEPTQTTLIGRKMKLKLRHKEGTGESPDGYQMQDKGFVIEGIDDQRIIQNYDISTAVLTPFTSAFIQDSLAEYYYAKSENGYIVAAAAVLTYDANTATNVVIATATYDAKAPQVTLMSHARTGGQAGPQQSGEPIVLSLGYKDPTFATAGIHFVFEAALPAEDTDGWVMATQTVRARHTLTGAGLPTLGVIADDQSYLDGCVAYASSTTHSAVNAGMPPRHSQGSVYRWEGYDSPGGGLISDTTSGYNIAAFNFDASMHFMYRPSGSESIWVPLSGVDWSTYLVAERAPPYVGAGKGWAVVSDSTTSTTVDPAFPQWTAKWPQPNGLPNCAGLPTN